MPTTMPTAQQITDAFTAHVEDFGIPEGGDIIVNVLLAKRAPGVDGPLTNEAALTSAFTALLGEGVASFGEGNVALLQFTASTEPATTVGEVRAVSLTDLSALGGDGGPGEG